MPAPTPYERRRRLVRASVLAILGRADLQVELIEEQEWDVLMNDLEDIMQHTGWGSYHAPGTTVASLVHARRLRLQR